LYWSSGGTASTYPVGSGGYYDAGSTVSLTATPASGYQFMRWSYDAGGTSRSTSLVANKSWDVAALFGYPGYLSSVELFNAASPYPNFSTYNGYAYPFVSPGEVFTVYSPGIGPSSPATAQPGADGTIGTTLAGVQVFIGATPIPVVAVDANSATAIAPFALANYQSVSVTLGKSGRYTNTMSVDINQVNPAVYSTDGSGNGQAKAYNDDGSANAPGNPAARGSMVTFFATGLGVPSAAVPEGQILSSVGPMPAASVEVRIGGVVVDDFTVGGAPGYVPGVYRVHARVPDGVAPADTATVVVVVNGVPSQLTCTVAVN
jgi:uncharacterized protein (TIGR03437 family)